MKPWLVIIIMLFIAIAGYQFGFYHGKLARSDTEKFRLNSVLERTRVNVPSELKVITPSRTKGDNRLSDNSHSSGAINQRNMALRAEHQLAEFLTYHPNGKLFSLNTLKCSTDKCQFTGDYSGKQADFSRLLDDLKAQPWWQKGVAQTVKHVNYGITRVDITFTTQPTRVKDVIT